MRIRFLGTGTSHGVPPLDCMINNYESCPTGVCIKTYDKHYLTRTRSSVLIEADNGNILIDASQDFRRQALDNRVKTIDAMLVTHPHADHIGGIPDIRSYTSKEKPIPLFGSNETITSIRSYYPYIFDPCTFEGGGIPKLNLNQIEGAEEICGEEVIPIPVVHSTLKECFGYRVGNTAYIPDIKSFKKGALSLLKELDILIIDALRREYPHSTHLILPESIEIAKRLRPRLCYFTHISHGLDPEVEEDKLPEWISFAYDGLILESS